MDKDILKMCFNTLQTAETFRNERDYYQRLYFDADLDKKDLLKKVEDLKAETERLTAEINRLKAEKKSE